MKKQFTIVGVLLLSVVASLFLSSAAFAKGESFEYTNANTGSGRGGSKIVASGGAFKSATTFTLVSDSVANSYGAKLDGYSFYYKADSFNLRSDATTYAKSCGTDPAFIALKSAEATQGRLYASPLAAGGITSGCSNAIGMNFSNLVDPDSQYLLSDTNSIKADSVWLANMNGYYNALSAPLNSIKTGYYSSLGSRAPCSSQGCDDSNWKANVALCWQNARTSAAQAAALNAQAGKPYDSDSATKSLFANCLSGKINNVASSDQIMSAIKDVSAATVNQTGGTAREEAQNNLDNQLADADNSDEDAASSTCVVEGVGWIVCPITNFLASIADKSFEVVSHFLNVNVKLLDTSSGTFAAWSVFRSIANIFFVIVFLIIIYSQLTGQGVSNYGVKKTLPRLVVAAVLVNASFFICQFVVDLSQIAGGSIKDLLSNIPISTGNTAVPTWTDTMSNVLMGVGLAAISIAGVASIVAISALSISLPVLLAALLAILMTVLILIGRQAVIVILIVLSPLAFVAYMLPNTEKWFKKWVKVFSALLLVFPTVALLYGGGELTSKILSSVANSPETGNEMKFWLSITAMAVAALPLIMTPSLLKGAMNATGTLGAKLSGFASKTNGRVKNTAMSGRLGEARQGLKNSFALRRATRRANSGLQRTIDNSKVGRRLGLDKGSARALRAIDQEQDSEVEARVAQIQYETTSTDRVDKSATMLKNAIAAGDITTARAAQKILLSSGTFGLNKLQSVYSDNDVASTLARSDRGELTGFLRSEINSAGLKGKNNSLARWGFEGPADALANGYIKKGENGAPDTTVRPFSEDVSTYAKLNAVELAGQTIGNLQNGRSHITADAAAAVLNNSAAAALLDGEKRQLFTEIANGGATTSTASPTTVVGAAPSSDQQGVFRPDAREFTREQVQNMGADNAQKAAEMRGYENLHDGDVLTISNVHRGTPVGDKARQEAISRGLVTPPTPRDPNTMPK